MRYTCDVLYVTLISPEAKRKEAIKAALRRQKEPVWAMQDVSVKAYWLSDVGHESYCTKPALVEGSPTSGMKPSKENPEPVSKTVSS